MLLPKEESRNAKKKLCGGGWQLSGVNKNEIIVGVVHLSQFQHHRRGWSHTPSISRLLFNHASKKEPPFPPSSPSRMSTLEIAAIEPLMDSNKKKLEDMKDFAEMVQTFSEKIGGSAGAQRLDPIVLFVKNYLRYYSLELLDQVSAVQFKNSRVFFEKNMSGLSKKFEKLNNAYISVFDEEQIANYAIAALQDILGEAHDF
ncbi:hypothetical protein B9Z55_024358 [Caenorhabditis nigoni]|uniref:Uncharacterized protein n=2 Tax=Caenorhabditis nigoni TaxID=1611254 RepID=A0A2G5SU76_9PELO|nr:hypothetical protein B9Z55_024358 [Caenorhabditis nigoni]